MLLLRRKTDFVTILRPRLSEGGQRLAMGRIRFRRARSQTPNTVSFWLSPSSRERALSELLSAYYLCVKADSSSVSWNSPSLAQNSVSSLFGNSTLETVFRPFPKRRDTGLKIHAKIHDQNPRRALGEPLIVRQVSGKEKAHKHKQILPVTARVVGVS